MKVKKKKTIKRISFLVVVFAIIAFVSTSIFNLATKKDIEYVLKSEHYSYLPLEAKNYIKEVYKESGEIVLTEKNKEENKPYLNPDYIEYISLPQEEKEQVAVIPEVYALDYVFNKSYGNQESLPSSYDSRNVNGNNYVTEIRDQGDLDVCWTFATAETAETYLLATKKQTATSNSQLFSERQLDYATSNNGIKNYQSEYRSFIDRELGSGGNFFVATTALANGISLVDSNWKTYDDTDLEQMELYEVLNYENSLYELNTSINMPRFNVLDLDMTKTENIELREQYINTIKSNIMKYGSAFVGTGSPNSNDGCAYYDSTLKNYVISVDKTCNVKDHAMQIIGWDDSISYSYCADNASKHTTTSNCENKVSGTGVWILRNSWGTKSSSAYPYPYLAYDSYNTDISFITDLDASYEKTWDNNYVLGDTFDPVPSTEKTFNLDINNNEKITKIKFMSYSQNASYDVEIIVDGKKTNEVYKISNSQPGLVTLDLSSKNINFKDSISIKVTGKNDSLLLSQLYLFTTNVEETALLSFDKDKSLVIDKVNIRLYASTKNIDSNSTITYRIYNKANEDVSDKMTYENNIVAENNVNTSIILDETLPKGDYKIDAIFEDKVLDSIYIINEISGSGTEEDPYVITNSTQLYDIRDDVTAYYVLGNDIDLTSDTRKGGKYYNSGEGWEGASNFSGTFDGKGYTIKGLFIGEDENYAGLFTSLAGNVNIKNLVLEDFDISCDFWCGALAGIYGDYSSPITDENNINISNIAIKNSNIKGYNPEVYANAQNHRIGGLMGGIFATNSNVNINNIYMNANVDFTYESMYSAGTYRDVKGGAALIRDVKANNFTMRNIQLNGEIKRPEYLIDNLVVNNNVQEYIINTANKKVDLAELTKRETYNDWKNFNDYWIMETPEDGIPRIPILRIAADDFEYTSINDITIELTTSEYPNIYDYITPDTSFAHRISYEMEENPTVLMEGSTLKPLSPGTTSIHVKSYYDGYERDIPITVTHSSQTPYYVVVFYPNGVDEDPISTIYNKNSYGNTLTSNPYSKYNFDFIGWNTKADGTGTSYENREKINPDIENGGVIVLYAQWKAKKRTITFDPNGGTGEIVTKQFDYNSYYGEEMPIPTREGYGFDGWVYKSCDSCSERTIKPNTRVDDIDTITVTAKWIENSYTIIHHPNGGERYYEPSNSRYENNFSVGTLGVDTKITYVYQYKRDGYTFKNWNTKPDGTGTSYENYNDEGNYTKVNLTNVEGGVLNLYAIWEPNTYTITFDSNFGTGTMEKQTFTSADTFNINENTFTRQGYKFVGWNTKSDGTGTSYSDKQEISECTKYLYLYAQWEIIKYTVTFNANDGTANSTTQEIEYNTSTPLTKNTFTRDGFAFVEWNTNADGTGTAYSNGQSVTINENLNLFAIWREGPGYIINKYSIDESNKYIDLIDINTPVDEFKKNIEVNDGYTVEVDYKSVNGKNLLYTGGKTKIYKNNELIVEYTNIIRGDVNGNATIDIIDYIRIMKHIMEEIELKDEVYKAADVNQNEKIDIIDYIRIMKMIMEEN